MSSESRTFLILGGYGLAGRAIASHLLRETTVRLVLGGRTFDKAERTAAELNGQFPGGRVGASVVDAANPGSLRSALEAVDFVIVASPTTPHTRAVAGAALAAGVDYLDIQMSVHGKLETLNGLARRIEDAGLCFITEAGFHPGLPAALVRYLATSFDRLDRAFVAALLSVGESLALTDSFDELVEVFESYRAEVYEDRRWETVPWGGMLDTRRIDFGPPFGKRFCAPMMFEEMRRIPERFPSLQSAGVYMAGFNWVADLLIGPVMMASLAVSPERAERPMSRLFSWAIRTFSSPPYGLVLKAEATGVKDGRLKALEVFLSHEDGYVFTAVPVVACLLQYLDGSARRPGLWMMGHLVDPVRLVADMERMGIRVRIAAAPEPPKIAGRE